MRTYTELERDLSHIKAAISFLELTRYYLFPRGSLDNPAYWQSRLREVLDARPGDTIFERQGAELLERLQRLQAGSPAKSSANAKQSITPWN